MPKIPIYTPQETIPAKTGLVRISPEEAAAPGRALMQEGMALQKVGTELSDFAAIIGYNAKKIEKENDELKVVATLTKFRGEQRARINDFRSLMGENAATGFGDVEKWHLDKAKEYEGGLTSDYQKKLWQTRVAAEIDSGLSVAATHAAEQRRAWKADTIDSVLTDALVALDMSRGDDVTLQNTKNQLQETLTVLYPEQDMSQYRLKAFAQLERKASEAKFKYAETNAYLDVMLRNGNDPRTALDEWMKPETLTKYGLTDQQWRSGQQNFTNAIKQAQEKDETAAAEQEFSLLEAYNRRGLSFDSVVKASSSIQDPQVRAKFQGKWQGLIDKQLNEARSIRAAEVSASSAARAAAAAERAANPFLRGNPDIEAKWIQKSLDAPHKINKADLAALHGAGISTKVYEQILGHVKSGETGVWQSPNGKLVSAFLKQNHKNSVFDTDTTKNQAAFNIETEHFSNWLKENPKATAQQINAEMEARMKDYRKNSVRRWLEEKGAWPK